MSCGNGQADAGENCDDGNTSDGDGCSSDCQVLRALLLSLVDRCVPQVESCSTGDDGADKCYQCGDSMREGNEQCDDGNQLAGDGCSPDCAPEDTYQ